MSTSATARASASAALCPSDGWTSSDGTNSSSSNDVASGGEANGAVISARRSLGRKEEQVPAQPPQIKGDLD